MGLAMRIALWLLLAHSVRTLSPSMRQYVIDSQNRRCKTCGTLFSAYFDPRMQYLDHNRSNAARDNLVCICAMCEENRRFR
tara:strand:+ start:8599 stop:8841 length:243 start_codon:yes stop_codon:yes gene_type:complete